MTTEEFISAVIDKGVREGTHALVGKARVVFTISEVEVSCDMNGIDTVLDHVENGRLDNLAAAFAAIGAMEIASELEKIERALPARDHEMLSRANDLITSRTGYSYETIKAYVEARDDSA